MGGFLRDGVLWDGEADAGVDGNGVLCVEMPLSSIIYEVNYEITSAKQV